MSAPRWSLKYFAGYNLDGEAVWKGAAEGRSRLRAAAVFLICTSARPEVLHRLVWQQR